MDWKKIWSNINKALDFIWNDNSVWSWMLNILIAFVLIKFIIYPGIGVLLGTNLPIVAVISESMSHDGTFDDWWHSPAICEKDGKVLTCTQEEWYLQNDISIDEFKKYPMHNGFNKGDIILLRGADFETLEVGEILVYQSKLSYPVIHRVVYKEDIIGTKGDHNQKQVTDARLNEKYITKDQMIGKAWIRIPYLGYVKILFVQAVQCVTFRGCTFG